MLVPITRNGKDTNPWFLKFMDSIVMDTVLNGKLAEEFDKGERKLIPLVFSHGLGGNNTMHSCQCRDLASHGFIVFTISHFDGTAHYTMNHEKKEQYWINQDEVSELEFRNKQTDIRKQEIRYLIDEILTIDFLQQKLNFSVSSSIDSEKLVMSGYSFGGMTAIATAREDPRCKFLFAIDPWMLVGEKEMLEGEFVINIP